MIAMMIMNTTAHPTPLKPSVVDRSHPSRLKSPDPPPELLDEPLERELDGDDEPLERELDDDDELRELDDDERDEVDDPDREPPLNELPPPGR
jgi:hypothetical protein